MTYSVVDWWDTAKAIVREDATRRMTCSTFKTRFLEKYFPKLEENKGEKEFIELVKGSMIVLEYNKEFKRLSRFSLYIINTPEKKISRHHQGLKLCLSSLTMGYLDRPFEALVELATRLEDIISIIKSQTDSQIPEGDDQLPLAIERDKEMTATGANNIGMVITRLIQHHHHLNAEYAILATIVGYAAPF